jgi:glycosyltransferase involved in cell wall biosynthesis
MNVLHVTTRFESGGAERNLVHFMRVQQDMGHRITLAAGRTGSLLALPPGVNLIEVPGLGRSPNPARDIHAFRVLRDIIREGAYDVVHTHESKAGVLGRLAARDRVQTILHTVHMASFGPVYGKGPSALFSRLERHCATFTDRMIFVGTELRDLYLAAGIGHPATSLVIHSPIDLERFFAVRELADAARRALRGFALPAAAGSVPVVLMLGVLEARKRHVLALRGLAPMMRTHGLHLVIAGEGPERAAIEAEAARLGVGDRLHLMGHVQAPERLMAVSDLFLHTSRVEGVAQSVVQALAAGLPVVATEVTGLKEAGPQVTVARSTAEGIAAAVNQALRLPGRPPPVESFTPWSYAAVEYSIAALHEALSASPDAIPGLRTA